ncbi:hypothetical protein JKP88DRAFT_277197 [Tribonema minus]|uniref:Uncharacterized protein n=1 Tax=Tribonema minus TaxID=303371 RepID=A0A835Z108_9STRA|nr:hypothetical protein JKP88DRAFT_277197 [Tribonema minus]
MVASVPLLDWAFSNGYKEDVSLQWYAAKFGTLEVMQYAYANAKHVDIDPSQDSFICTGAAVRGHLEMLQWARAQKFYWDSSTTAAAARGGHQEVLQWAHAHGCPLDRKTWACSGAVRGGHLHALQWLHEAVGIGEQLLGEQRLV